MNYEQLRSYAMAWDQVQAARIAMNNLIKSYERREVLIALPLPGWLEELEANEKAHLRVIQKGLRETEEPWLQRIYQFKEDSFGIGPAIFCIVGLLPPLPNFANPAKLWKYLGLDVIDGKAPKGADAKYSRKLKAYTIGRVVTPVITGGGPYRMVYDARKLHTITVHPEWGTANSKAPKMHYERDARRYTAKRILRDLWRAAHGSPAIVDTQRYHATVGEALVA